MSNKRASNEEEAKQAKKVKAPKQAAIAVKTRLGFNAGLSGYDKDLEPFYPTEIADAIKALPPVAVRYFKATRRRTDDWGLPSVSLDWDFKMNDWRQKPMDDNLVKAVLAYATDAPGVREAVAKYKELAAKGDAHVHHLFPGRCFDMCNGAVYKANNAHKRLFDFACQTFPEFKGPEAEPYTARDFETEDLLIVAKCFIADSHKHHVLTEPAPLPPAFQRMIDFANKKAAQSNK